MLLILSGVAIATLTGKNGILTQANKAKTEMEKQGALEKVKIAIMGSYEANGSGYGQSGSSIKLDYGKLKDNLEAIDGYKGMSVGENEDITENSFPISITVDEAYIKIKDNGEAELNKPYTVETPSSYDFKYDLSENDDQSVLCYVNGDNLTIVGERENERLWV